MSALGLPAEEVALIREYSEAVFVGRVAMAIGLALVVYDCFQTLPDEIRFYWKDDWSLPKMLYFVIRYSVLLMLPFCYLAVFNPPSNNFCKAFYNIHVLLDPLLVWSTETVLLFRINAVYNSKPLCYGLSALLCCALLTEGFVGLIGVNITEWGREPIPALGLIYCWPITYGFFQETHWLMWVPAIVFDSVLFLLAVYKLYEYKTTLSSSMIKTTLLSTLLQDSIFYYASIIVMAILYMAIARHHVQYAQPACNILFPLISACGCRLMFHIKQRNRDSIFGGSTSQYACSAMNFRTMVCRDEFDRAGSEDSRDEA